MACSLLNVGLKNVIYTSQSITSQMSNRLCSVILQAPSNLCLLHISTKHSELTWAITPSSKTRSYSSFVRFQAPQGNCSQSSVSKQLNKCHSLIVTGTRNRSSRRTCLDISLGSEKLNLHFRTPKQTRIQWSQHLASLGLFIGLVCCSSSVPVHADALAGKQNKEDDDSSSSVSYSHGKKVCTDYSVTGEWQSPGFLL